METTSTGIVNTTQKWRESMGYIQELRSKVGNTPLIMVGASMLALNSKSELLMMRRTDNDCWGIPGGNMEPGEHIEETARRETREETGLEVGNMQLFKVFSGPELYYRYPNGDEVYIVSVAFISNDLSGSMMLDTSEHSEMDYFPLDNMPELISPPIQPILKELREKLHQT
jgi:ADP-ribose pyrophosphatase YjhB (NUDIX family)